MNVNEAYQVVLDAVEEIKQTGIEVTIRPSSCAKRPETVKKYSGPECVSPDKWVHVTFHVKMKDDANLVHKKLTELGWFGIGFDTGGCAGQRDWELDWSFRCHSVPDGDRQHDQDEVEDLIQTLIENPKNE